MYEFGPVFRAENCKSRLHLSEFYMVEAEIAFVENIEEILKLIERLIKNVTKDILDSQEEEINDYRKSLSLPQLNLNNIIERPYAIMTFEDACSILKRYKDEFETPVDDCKHLTKEHELRLVEHNDNVPVFIVDWPIDRKPFYVKTSPLTAKVRNMAFSRSHSVRDMYKDSIGTYRTLSRARLHFGTCYWSIFLNVYLKDFFFSFWRK